MSDKKSRFEARKRGLAWCVIEIWNTSGEEWIVAHSINQTTAREFAAAHEMAEMLKRLHEEIDHGYFSECKCSRDNKCMGCILLDDTDALLSRIEGE